ncbi:MAG: cell division protein FtsA [Acidobacteria bacterium]|nr:cell division protein FtsA [Acidobacteriota bacterium]
MKTRERQLAALDLGSNKVAALICEAGENGRIDLRGAGIAESKGFRKDTLVHLDAAVGAIRQAVEAAEKVAGLPVESVVVGVAGRHIRSLNSRGGITLGTRPREVMGEDIRRAIEAARAVSLPPEQELMHVLPQEFLLDQQSGIRDPLGLLGRRLEVNVHLVAGAAAPTQNLIAAVNRAGIIVQDTVLEPLAAAEACLTPDERELGAVLVDIGAGSTNWIVFQQGAPHDSGLVPVGGEHFTQDIAIGLSTPLWEAERIKRGYGCAWLRGLGQDTLFEVASVGERPPRLASRRTLCEIVEPRAAEWVALLREALERPYGPTAGVVLTGGGAQLEGLVDLTAQEFQVPVRIGLPKGLAGASSTLSNPACATVAGLVLHANRLRLARSRPHGRLGPLLRNFFTGRAWAAGV